MDEEIYAIEKNKTWELAHLLTDKKPIGVKWVHETKYKPSCEIDRFKARLIAKGYKQKPEFREAMISCFEMTDLGQSSYFLGIEVIQQDDIFSQKQYASDMLKNCKMENSKQMSRTRN